MFDPSSFLNPSLLWLGVGALAPIIIHLMARSRPKPTPFPAVRFILASHRKSSAKFKLKQLLLLLLRIAVLALFAVVIARPWTRGSAANVTYAKTDVTAVILLDTSLSMGCQSGDQMALEKAAEMALAAIDAFTPDSPVCLLYVGDTPEPVITDFKHAFNVDSLKESIRNARLTCRGTNCTAALKQAIQMLNETKGVGKSIFLLTDLTERAWPSPVPADDKAGDIAIYIGDAGTAAASNPAVLGVKAPATVAAGTSFEVRATVDATGAAGRQVGLVIDGEKRAERPASAHKIEQVALIASASKPVPEHWGRVSLSGVDGLGLDNSRYFSFRTSATMKLVLVNGAPSTVAQRDELYFLRIALAPGGLAAGQPFALAEITAPQLESADLSDADLVILCNVGTVSTAAWTKLRHFVSAGRGLIVFGGDNVDPEAYEPVSKGEIALLPCSIGPAFTPPEPTQLEPGQLKHRILHAFQEGRNGDLAAAKFSTYLKLTPSAEVPHEIVMAFRNGDPAVVAGTYRAGRVLVFASSCDADWNTFPKQGVPYVVLLHEAVKFLAPFREEQRDVGIGAAPVLRIAAPGTVARVEMERLPDDFNRELDLLLKRSSAAEAHVKTLKKQAETRVANLKEQIDLRTGQLPLPSVEAPGIYRVAIERTGGAAEEMFFAANIDAAESNLTRLAEDERMEDAVKAFLPGRKVRFARTPAELREHLSRSESVAELASHFAGIMLVILIAEMYLSNRMRARVDSAQGTDEKASG